MTPARAKFIKKMRDEQRGYEPRVHLHRRWRLRGRPPANPSRSDERRQRQIAAGQLTAANGLS